MTICSSKAIQKKCRREVSEPGYFNAKLCQKYRECSERGSGDGIDIGGREHVASLNPFLMVAIGSHKWSLASHSTLQVELAETHFEGEECTANIEKRQGDRRLREMYPIPMF